MNYTRFEEMPMYQEALSFCKMIYRITEKKFGRDYGLIDQVRRAAVSILLNIAEGFERKSNKEFANFINYAKGSTCEVRAVVTLACEIGYIEQKQKDDLMKKLVILSDNFGKFQNYLRRSAA